MHNCGLHQSKDGIKLTRMVQSLGSQEAVALVWWSRMNEKGQIMGALCRRLELPLGALEVEAKAVEEGVQFARDLSLGQIVIKCDSDRKAHV